MTVYDVEGVGGRMRLLDSGDTIYDVGEMHTFAARGLTHQ